MSDTRKLIDFAYEENGSEFRDALYSAIHDKVTAHIDAKRAEIAQTLITQQEEEVEYDEEYEDEEELEESYELNERELDYEYHQRTEPVTHPHKDAPYGRDLFGPRLHPEGKLPVTVMKDGQVVKNVHIPHEHHSRLQDSGKIKRNEYGPEYMARPFFKKGDKPGRKTTQRRQRLEIDHKDFAKYEKNNAKHVSAPFGESAGVHEAGSPFDKDYKSQIATKPGEKAGFTSKKVSTGTVFSRVPPKVEPTKEK
jgi:hypothetical protein